MRSLIIVVTLLCTVLLAMASNRAGTDTAHDSYTGDPGLTYEYVEDGRGGHRPVAEDDPQWNCATMGNRVCGRIAP